MRWQNISVRKYWILLFDIFGVRAVCKLSYRFLLPFVAECAEIVVDSQTLALQ